MIKLFTFLSTFFLLIGCSKDYSAQEIKERSASGVALLINQYYYQLNTGDGQTYYFTGIENDTLAHLTDDEKKILPHRNGITGTAFFVNKEGRLLTNRHVAAPSIEKNEVKNCYRRSMLQLKEYCEMQMGELTTMFEQNKKEIANMEFQSFFQDNEEELLEKREEQETISTLYTTYKKLRDGINLDTSELTISTVSELAVGYDGTFPTKIEDYHSCVLEKASTNENDDLALVRLKEGKTPDGSYVFQIAGMNEDNKIVEEENIPLHTGDPLFMIGFNAGLNLAFTSNGLKAQINEGKVTQDPDISQVLYNISTLPGSSGSPVMNSEGEVVAVNFAKIGKTDTFNFGIPLRRIHNFLTQ